MKKHIATQLNAIAETIPHVFVEEDDYVPMKGEELLLTPLAHLVQHKDDWYNVYIPKFVAVDHKQQVKDSYKRGGWPEVQAYMFKVLKQCGLDDNDIKNLVQTKRQEINN